MVEQERWRNKHNNHFHFIHTTHIIMFKQEFRNIKIFCLELNPRPYSFEELWNKQLIQPSNNNFIINKYRLWYKLCIWISLWILFFLIITTSIKFCDCHFYSFNFSPIYNIYSHHFIWRLSRFVLRLQDLVNFLRLQPKQINFYSMLIYSLFTITSSSLL